MEHRGHIPIKTSSARSFAFLLATVLFLLGAYLWIIDGNAIIFVLVPAAAVLGFIGIACPQILHLPNQLWIKLGLLLGKIVSPVILALVYFVFLSPLALISRFFGSDPLKIRNTERRKETFWMEREDNDHCIWSMSQQY